jgi:RNA polymerase sigma factor (sigma-70 family)
MALETAAQRGREADRELANALGMPGPSGRAATAGYLDELDRRPQLPRDLEQRLVAAAKAGDADARARLVEAYLPLIASVARNYAMPYVERLELIQEGVAGLLRALERFDPDRGTPFWAYARWWVRQAMRRLIAELGDAATLSGHALGRLARLREAQDELMQELRREPSDAEAIERAGLDREEAEKLLAATRTPRSLQEPLTGEDGGITGTRGDLVSDPLADDEYERVLDRIEAQEMLSLLSVLSDRERTVLRLHHGLDGPELTYREVGERLGISPSRVRKIERRALGKLRAAARRSGVAA